MAPRLKLLNNCIYFDVVVGALSDALSALQPPVEHAVVSALEPGDRDSVYVMCTTHHLHEPLPARYIAYNFEQLITDRVWPPEFFGRLRRAVQVWDYSLENIRVLEANGVPGAVHLPFGFSPRMVTAPAGAPPAPLSERPVHWLFLGAMSQLRAAKLRPLADRYAAGPGADKALVTNGCWGAELAAAYARTRVGVNLHFYPGKTILEVHRIVPMVANRVWVVSERSDDPWYDEAFKNVVTFIPRGADAGKALAACVDLVCDKLDAARAEADIDKRFRELSTACSYLEFVRARRHLLRI